MDEEPRTHDEGRDLAGTPRWVKVFGAIALAVVVLFVVLLLARGPHNPSRHLSGGERQAARIAA